MNLIEHYIILALESAGVKISPDMRGEIAGIEQDIIDKAKAVLREEFRPLPPGFKYNDQ